MYNFWFSPAWVYFLGALGLLFKWRDKDIDSYRSIYLILIPLAAFLVLVISRLGVYDTVYFSGQWITLGRLDRLSMLFGIIFIIMSLIGVIYGLHERERKGLWIAAFIYVGGALGVVFAGDFITVFIFSEVMAFSSVFLIWLERSDQALKAGFRYILMHLFGGVCLLGGVAIHYVESHSIAFEPQIITGLGSKLLLIGFLVNAAVPPLSAWLSDAYPEATVVGAVFLSAFTTKTAVYTLIRGFPGTEILIWLGAIMAIYGVVYAVLENDIRRLLAYHIISQVGYMVAGVGIGTELALNGAGAHAFSHILYKGLLFMGAGAVIHVTGRRKLTELGGLYKYMPLTVWLYMIGAFSISAFPLFSGFVSKSMVIAAAGESHLIWIWLMLTLASAGTFLHTGLKLPYYTFFAKAKEWKPDDQNYEISGEVPANMLLAMAIAAAFCILIGFFPNTLYSLLPYATDFHPYTAAHIIGSLQLLLFTLLGFMLLLKMLDPEKTISVDMDWFYRKVFYFAGDSGSRFVTYLDSRWSEFYNMLLWFVKGIAWVCFKFEFYVVDATVNGIAKGIRKVGNVIRVLQTGQIQHYALVMVLSIILMMSYYLFLR